MAKKKNDRSESGNGSKETVSDVDLLEHFRGEGYSRERLFFLMGADNLAILDSWHDHH